MREMNRQTLEMGAAERRDDDGDGRKLEIEEGRSRMRITPEEGAAHNTHHTLDPARGPGTVRLVLGRLCQ